MVHNLNLAYSFTKWPLAVLQLKNFPAAQKEFLSLTTQSLCAGQEL